MDKSLTEIEPQRNDLFLEQRFSSVDEVWEALTNFERKFKFYFVTKSSKSLEAACSSEEFNENLVKDEIYLRCQSYRPPADQNGHPEADPTNAAKPSKKRKIT